uniref:Ribonuclease E n=1 Tax=Bostrychia simpliciuscula TaxID=324754 RepID=A0A1Z1M7L6_9FLOR|nr:ribonuclease E [Bostrychia simpliciuscula]ARW62006.1 ribonuclease E [Bostrychia simpliciuscula]
MVKKIIISHFNNVAAILYNNRIEEIIIINNTYQVNNIYIGVVQKIFSSINAAFVKLSKYGKSGFIHISDIKSLKRGKNTGRITDILSINQLILVQVTKEPTINKGPRITANIHLYGKYIVLMPFCNIILISHKIYDNNQRLHLYSLAVLIKPQSMGLLIKSSAKGVSSSIILKDLDLLLEQWYFVQKVAIINSGPTLIYKDEDLIKKIIRDFYENSVKKIIVDSENALKLLYYYLKKWYCISSLINTQLQFYNKPDCILDRFYIKQAIKNALKSKVKLLSGGYIIIESYEALTIVDVNSGSFNKLNNSKETILRTNFYAAIEIAYQLRIRNINGVIIIDFIDMHSERDQLQLLEHFNKLLIFDDAKPKIVQLSELGLLELTRRRRSQSLREIFDNSTLIKWQNFGSYFTNHFYSKLFFNIPSKYLKKQLLVHKNIRSLFFDKEFKNNKILTYKFCSSNQNLYNQYFVFIDSFFTVHFFKPKCNYLLPLFFYLKFIDTK